MKNLIRLFLILIIVGGGISVSSSCSDESNCSMAGRPMMYCALKYIDLDTKAERNDTLDSLTITALGTDSIILNNEKKVHKLMLPLRYTSDSTVFVFKYDPVRQPLYSDTLYIIQQNTPYFQSMECGYLMRQNILNVKVVKGKYTPPGITPRQLIQMESVVIQNKEANTNEIQNLQIFYQYRTRSFEIN